MGQRLSYLRHMNWWRGALNRSWPWRAVQCLPHGTSIPIEVWCSRTPLKKEQNVFENGDFNLNSIYRSIDVYTIKPVGLISKEVIHAAVPTPPGSLE